MSSSPSSKKKKISKSSNRVIVLLILEVILVLFTQWGRLEKNPNLSLRILSLQNYSQLLIPLRLNTLIHKILVFLTYYTHSKCRCQNPNCFHDGSVVMNHLLLSPSHKSVKKLFFPPQALIISTKLLQRNI